MGPSFEEIYARYADAVFRFAFRLVGRRDVAEDITSEAFLELVEHQDRVDVARLPGWLFTVARNRAMDYWRRQTLESRFVAGLQEPIQPEPTFEPKLFDHQALRPVHRACLLLRYVHGMTLSEIAQYTGLSEMQIKGYLQYARQLLRSAFTKAT